MLQCVHTSMEAHLSAQQGSRFRASSLRVHAAGSRGSDKTFGLCSREGRTSRLDEQCKLCRRASCVGSTPWWWRCGDERVLRVLRRLSNPGKVAPSRHYHLVARLRTGRETGASDRICTRCMRGTLGFLRLQRQSTVATSTGVRSPQQST